MSKILARIASETGVPQLVKVLAEDLSPSDLQSLLLHVYQVRAGAQRAADLVESARRPLLEPSKVDARITNQFDQAAFEAADAFQAVELSPVGPLGLTRVLGEIDQNNVLTTIRNAEVLGDPTPAMALECARRRRDVAQRRSSGPVHLCSSQRAIRLQPFDFPGYTPHFRLFALVSAGRDTGSHAFEMRCLGEHIRVYLKLFRALNGRGFSLRDPLVEVSDVVVTEGLLKRSGIAVDELRATIRAHRPGGSGRFLAERGVKLPDAIEDPAQELPGLTRPHPLTRVKTELFEGLRREFAEARFSFNLARLEGLGYYRGLCLRISPVAPDGNRYVIVDGGITDWTARLLGDRKERLLATGIGSEFTCVRYRAGG